MATEAAPPILRSPATFLGFEIVSGEGKRRRDRRVVPGAGRATLTGGALCFRGARQDQIVAIPIGDIHRVALAPSHNGRRWWSGKVVKIAFGGGETRVLGLHMASGEAEEWRRRLLGLTSG